MFRVFLLFWRVSVGKNGVKGKPKTSKNETKIKKLDSTHRQQIQHSVSHFPKTWLMQTCDGNFSRPFARAVEDALGHCFHVTRMALFIAAENGSELWMQRKVGWNHVSQTGKHSKKVINFSSKTDSKGKEGIEGEIFMEWRTLNRNFCHQNYEPTNSQLSFLVDPVWDSSPPANRLPQTIP